MNKDGTGFSKYKDILINRYKYTNEYKVNTDFSVGYKFQNGEDIYYSSYLSIIEMIKT
mgnify:CR=1 FL=1